MVGVSTLPNGTLASALKLGKDMFFLHLTFNCFVFFPGVENEFGEGGMCGPGGVVWITNELSKLSEAPAQEEGQ